MGLGVRTHGEKWINKTTKPRMSDTLVSKTGKTTSKNKTQTVILVVLELPWRRHSSARQMCHIFNVNLNPRLSKMGNRYDIRTGLTHTLCFQYSKTFVSSKRFTSIFMEIQKVSRLLHETHLVTMQMQLLSKDIKNVVMLMFNPSSLVLTVFRKEHKPKIKNQLSKCR